MYASKCEVLFKWNSHISKCSWARWGHNRWVVCESSHWLVPGQLQRVFMFYTSWAEAMNFETLGSAGFMKLLRDCQILDSKFTVVDADLIFVENARMNLTQSDDNLNILADKRMTYVDFMIALQQIAQRKYTTQPSADLALSLLLSRDILPFASKQVSSCCLEDS